MKTKIGLPFGLALVVFLGVFTAMLALGVLSPQRAEAVTGDFMVTLSNPNPGEETGLSFTFTTTDGLSADDTITITFPDEDLDTAVVEEFVLTGNAIVDGDNWMVNGRQVTGTPTVSTNVIRVPVPAEIADPVDPETTIEIAVVFTDPETDPETAPTAEGSGVGIINPANDEDISSMFDVITTGDSTVGMSAGFTVRGYESVSVANAMVNNSPADPGARSQIAITFTTNRELAAGVDAIVLDIDASFGIPTTISANQVRIAANMVTDPDGATETLSSSPNQSIAPDFDPIYRLKPGGEGRVIYTVHIPDMDTRDVSGIENILMGANVTLTFLVGAGFTNPTEANTSGDDFTVSTSKQEMGAAAEVYTGIQLFIDDAADNRNKPLTVTGRGFKNGVTVIVYLDKNENDTRDAGDVDLDSEVVGSDDTFESTFNVTVPPFDAGKGNRIHATDGENPPNMTGAGEGVEFEVEGPGHGQPRVRLRGRQPTDKGG